MERLLETGRLVLRRFGGADLDALAELHGDPLVMRYIDTGRPQPREAVEREVLPAILRGYRELPDGLGTFAVLAKADGAFLGWVALQPADSVGLAAGGTELGYRFRPAAWGHGYATEAARALVGHAFAHTATPAVVATTMTVNAGSRRVMEKTGLRHVRTFHEEWPDYIEGAEHGDVEYLITRREWERAAVG
ncbi:GNAT family N-acetyltransferase [Kitasatospora sp. NPDC096147]|uniref:GNAT family N-acetyltransferase n=1 Tax=Kitasatospora sp. NPDC096147 TaxID=3364093 RepID=UPI003804C9C6